MNNLDKMMLFIADMKAEARARGLEISESDEGASLWPTYDRVTGGLGNWFTLFIRIAPKNSIDNLQQ